MSAPTDPEGTPTPEAAAARAVARAEQAGYERGKSEAVATAMTRRAAAVLLRAQADALAALGKSLGGTLPQAAAALSTCVGTLRDAATKLGG
jgi:acyl-CoA reductase-like NAD-dependent aldehyde dehydrogenase